MCFLAISHQYSKRQYIGYLPTQNILISLVEDKWGYNGFLKPSERIKTNWSSSYCPKSVVWYWFQVFSDIIIKQLAQTLFHTVIIWLSALIFFPDAHTIRHICSRQLLKHCCRRKNCSWWAIYNFAPIFSTLFHCMYFHSYELTL